IRKRICRSLSVCTFADREDLEQSDQDSCSLPPYFSCAMIKIIGCFSFFPLCFERIFLFQTFKKTYFFSASQRSPGASLDNHVDHLLFPYMSPPLRVFSLTRNILPIYQYRCIYDHLTRPFSPSYRCR